MLGPYALSLILMAPLVSFGTGLIFGWLRLRLGRAGGTVGQRETLAVLSWILLLNGAIGIGVWSVQVFGWSWTIEYVNEDLNVLIPFLDLYLGLIFPRPRTSPAWRRKIAGALAISALAVFAAALAIHAQPPFVYTAPGLRGTRSWMLISACYVVAWSVPLALWLPDYMAEPLPRARMVQVLLIWGFAGWVPAATVGSAIAYARGIITYDAASTSLVLWATILALFVVADVRALWARRGRWAAPERVNVALLVGILALGVIVGGFRALSGWTVQTVEGPGAFTLSWLLDWSTWLVLRPFLFATAVLRFQMFGAALRPERAFLLVGSLALLIALGGGVLELLGSWTNWTIGAASAAMIVAAVPVHRVLKSLAARWWAPDGAHEEADREAVRDRYLITLQTAAWHGTVPDAGDRDSLEDLRRQLGVTEREHVLLLAQLADRDRPAHLSSSPGHAFLMMQDGRLLARVGGEAADRIDPDIMAGMLVAIREYVATTLGKGAELERIQYGGEVLHFAAAGPFVLAVGAPEAGSAGLDERLHDIVHALAAKWGGRFVAWQGDAQAAIPLERDLVANLAGPIRQG